MSKRDMLKSKIDMALISASINGALMYKGEIDNKQLEVRNEILKNDLYQAIASAEFTNESEII